MAVAYPLYAFKVWQKGRLERHSPATLKQTMTSHGVKRRLDSGGLLKRLKARVTDQEEELAQLKNKLTKVRQELTDQYKHAYVIDARYKTMTHSAQSYMQSSQLAQQELKVCQLELKKWEGNPARAEKALDSLK